MTADGFKDKQIGFIGAGNMAEAMIKGLAGSGGIKPQQIAASEPLAARRAFMGSTYGIEVVADNREMAPAADILVLAVKPQVAAEVLAELAPFTGPDKLVISIVAGLTTDVMQKALARETRIIRTVPNTPVFVGEGMVAVADDGPALPEDYALAEALFNPVARTARMPEKLMDAALGVSGSGPAYVFVMIEALSDGGVKMGLPRETALTLAAQTLLGAAKMCLESGKHPGELKDMVTSPAGTTIAALHRMEAAGVRAALIAAVEAAARRAEELGRLV
ncbi:MAG: pyrroline-5-carboxylate reductase [Desulfobacterales bacterium]|nr:pyrroline-5-carboxylate reductase [Desulfobacterales bacterium]MDJ0991159.1 pyrroline-5-carboxylate reductase [Desulfobacterales bacterium]